MEELQGIGRDTGPQGGYAHPCPFWNEAFIIKKRDSQRNLSAFVRKVSLFGISPGKAGMPQPGADLFLTFTIRPETINPGFYT